VTPNVGRTDRIIRAALLAPAAIAIAVVVGLGTVGGVIALVVAAVMLGTAAVGFCPLYRLLGLNTCPVATRSRATRSSVAR
jgi:fatty acid desaturase